MSLATKILVGEQLLRKATAHIHTPAKTRIVESESLRQQAAQKLRGFANSVESKPEAKSQTAAASPATATISTVKELDSLIVGSVVESNEGTFVRTDSGSWQDRDGEQIASKYLVGFAPLSVLHSCA